MNVPSIKNPHLFFFLKHKIILPSNSLEAFSSSLHLPPSPHQLAAALLQPDELVAFLNPTHSCNTSQHYFAWFLSYVCLSWGKKRWITCIYVKSWIFRIQHFRTLYTWIYISLLAYLSIFLCHFIYAKLVSASIFLVFLYQWVKSSAISTCVYVNNSHESKENNKDNN